MWYIYIFTAIILTIKITDDLASLHTHTPTLRSMPAAVIIQSDSAAEETTPSWT